MQEVYHSHDNKRNVIGNITSLNEVIITVTRMNIQMLILLAAFHPPQEGQPQSSSHKAARDQCLAQGCLSRVNAYQHRSLNLDPPVEGWCPFHDGTLPSLKTMHQSGLQCGLSLTDNSAGAFEWESPVICGLVQSGKVLRRRFMIRIATQMKTTIFKNTFCI